MCSPSSRGQRYDIHANDRCMQVAVDHHDLSVQFATGIHRQPEVLQCSYDSFVYSFTCPNLKANTSVVFFTFISNARDMCWKATRMSDHKLEQTPTSGCRSTRWKGVLSCISPAACRRMFCRMLRRCLLIAGYSLPSFSRAAWQRQSMIKHTVPWVCLLQLKLRSN